MMEYYQPNPHIIQNVLQNPIPVDGDEKEDERNSSINNLLSSFNTEEKTRQSKNYLFKDKLNNESSNNILSYMKDFQSPDIN